MHMAEQLRDRDVRIVCLPPATVASVHILAEGDPPRHPELDSASLQRAYIEGTNLPVQKPDFRNYGFNHTRGEIHGYERWVTIPDDWEVSPPFVKKRFPGGLYAAYAIPMGAFEEWGRLWQWVENSAQFTFRLGDPACMNGLLEEHLNAYNHYQLKQFDADAIQLDLLIPIRERE
jgi:hypothetical protein